MQYLYELTEHPYLFKNTYWDMFIDYENPHHFDDTIIANRNKFVKDYQIKCHPANIPNYVHDQYWDFQNTNYGLVDHVEVYRTHDRKNIVLSSPYTNSGIHIYLADGWIPVDPSYSTGAYSYIKIIPFKN